MHLTLTTSKSVFKKNCFSAKLLHGFYIFILIFFGFSDPVNSQDLIKLKSGKEMKVSVIEESNDLVKYRDYNDPSGPVYSVRKDQVESIKYKKGSKEIKETEVKNDTKNSVNSDQQQFTSSISPKLTVKKRYVYAGDVKQSPRNVKTIMEDYPEAIKIYDSGRKMCNASNSCAFGVILTSLITSQIANGKENDTDARRVTAVGLGIDGAFIITAIVLSSGGKKKIRKAVDLYNSSAGRPVTYNLNLGLQENGICVSLKF